jgi:hypothetical protein
MNPWRKKYKPRAKKTGQDHILANSCASTGYTYARSALPHRMAYIFVGILDIKYIFVYSPGSSSESPSGAVCN